jgi:hypothetical protein
MIPAAHAFHVPRGSATLERRPASEDGISSDQSNA